MKSVDFFQMDILQLPKLNLKFDLIECCGVLHHMQNPEEGLCALLEVLDKDGFIKLGLYSELARIDIIKARNIIKSKNIDSNHDGIRYFRHQISSGKFPDILQLKQWSDFYTTSMCRDLCFHVQEHRYFIDEIQKLLVKYKLNFLGFMLDKNSKEKYAENYKEDKNQLDLHNWDQFERKNPNTFRSMYQFWLNRTKEDLIKS